MVAPTTCLSSYLTTQLLQFRNPQGAEENWLGLPEHIDNYFLHAGKVITTEIGATLLCVTAIVETVAYGVIFAVAFIPTQYRHFPQELLSQVKDRCYSSAFTASWNFRNVFAFNLCCTNVMTEEPFARYAIDHWPSGKITKAAFATLGVALDCFCSYNSQPYSISYRRQFDCFEKFFQAPWMSDDDAHYIANWCHERDIDAQIIGIQLPQRYQRQALHNYNVYNNGFVEPDPAFHVAEGAAFFRTHMLAPAQLTESTRQMIFEQDAEVYLFVQTRALYLYVFGAKRASEIPFFFKQETRQKIGELRRLYRQNQGAPLAATMRDFQLFENLNCSEQAKSILLALKAAAYVELQGSTFLTRCMAEALRV